MEPRPDGHGRLGRLGNIALRHARLTTMIWAVVVIGLGIFAPQVEHSLSGAGWEASGSESVAVRNVVHDHFGGTDATAIQVVIQNKTGWVTSGHGAAVIAEATQLLQADPRISTVVPPQPSATISPDGHTAILVAGAAVDSNAMVAAASDLKGPLQRLSGDGVEVNPTGASLLWSDFNAANLSAMMKSEMLSWPVTLAILVLAFGALVAAGLPLLLTMAGLVASAGSLVLINHIVPVSIWAMNFAMMFSLALGIDYALFMVVRYRAARAAPGASPQRAVGEMMDTAGKAVLLSGLTVLISLSAVLLVPSPAFRSMAGGIMASVMFVLAATLTLLPVVLGKLDARINKFALPWAETGEHRSPLFAAWGERLWAHPWRWGVAALVVLLVAAAPLIGLRTSMPSIKVLPKGASARVGYDQVHQAFGTGTPGMLQVLTTDSGAPRTIQTLSHDPGIAAVMPPMAAPDHTGHVLVTAVPTVDPSDATLVTTVDRLRGELEGVARIGGPSVENLDLKSQLDRSTPPVMGVVVTLGFVLLVIALQAPLLAIVGALAALLSTAAAFGASRLIFQDGLGAGIFRFESQGFVDAWAPVFFFAMIYAIAMDYTVFLLASAKEHFEISRDPKEAMVGALAHSGRVIFAAGAVMVAVFFTFSLAGPIPPKEMGVILGIAVLLDAFVVRLVLLPVLLRLMGRAAWWVPSGLARILPEISFSHG